MTNTPTAESASNTSITRADTKTDGEQEPGRASEDKPITPSGDAGLFDVDPDQADVSQDSEVAIAGDVDSFPLDVEP